jgi:hypothetical protein
MQRGQTPMFAREIIYTPYFYLPKRKHVGLANLLQPLLSIVLLLLIINARNTQHDLILVLGHPVNQGEACI